MTISPRMVLLFSGHMIDAPERKTPRFPPSEEPTAAREIGRVLRELSAGPQDIAICGGACGGDLLFAEAALVLGCRLEIYLPFEEERFVETSVAFANHDWLQRFERALKSAALLEVAHRPLDIGDDPFEANNRRMLEAARRFGDHAVEFVCLWNGQTGDAPGGAEHMMQEVRQAGGGVHWLDTRRLWGPKLS